MPDLIGKSGVLVHTVMPTDLATHWKNQLPVLATPILLWLAELATIKAVEGALAPDSMTVGIGHHNRHLAPTPVGFTLRIHATVVSATAKLIVFDVEATDGTDRILEGTHTRAIVDRNSFETRINHKIAGRQA